MPRKCVCGTRANFNLRGENIGVCCSKCKTPDMIDVVNKRCPCGKRPSFNVPGTTIGMCCMKCKTDDMIDVVNKRCVCGSLSTVFNIPGQTAGIYCKKCKTDEMIDVVSKRCPCGKIPHFNMLGQTTGVCCKDCKKTDMIDVTHNTCSCSCGKQPKFNVPGETVGICCSNCKTDEMVDVLNKMCPGYDRPCPVRTQLSNGHQYCMSCDPNDTRRKLYKRFEEEFFEYVKNKINVHQREFHVPFDQIETAKKFARLDGIVFGDGVVLCLEVDENGHQEYECDEHRMHLVTAELLQKYPGQVVSWVRVNPTVDTNNQWSKISKAIREKRFEDVVTTVSDILKTRDTRVVYVGFD